MTTVRVMLMTLLEIQVVVAEVLAIVSNSAVIIDSWLRLVNVRKQS